MHPLIAILGVAIAALVLLDFLATTISLRKEGPATRFVTGAVGRLVHLLGERPSRYCGPICLVSLALFWVAGQWAGWTLIFYGGQGALTGPDAAPAVGFLDTAGFAGATLSTLGLGVITPVEPWLHVVAMLAAVCGMMVLTLAVTYVINVQGVASGSRSAALDLRDAARVLESCPTADGRAEEALSLGKNLRSTLHSVADRRRSFALAQLYDVRGSPKDVAMRAATLRDIVRPLVERATAPQEREKLQLLVEALERVVDADDARPG